MASIIETKRISIEVGLWAVCNKPKGREKATDSVNMEIIKRRNQIVWENL